MESIQKHEEVMQNEQNQLESEAVRTPDKAAYLNRISELGAEDQAFLDGYLFAKLTAARRGA